MAVCSSYAPINASELGKYHAAVDEIDCGCGNVYCAPCRGIPPTDCVAGPCELVKRASVHPKPRASRFAADECLAEVSH